MPTGYTAKVEDGTITDFREFAMLCARAFGATVIMRDDPMDAPIPEFEPSDYHEKAERNAKRKLNALMETSDADLRKQWQSEHKEQLVYRETANADAATRRARYEAMLAKVEAWEPPSPDHQGMKDFMRQQLQDSMRFGCSEREAQPQKPFDEWKSEKIERAKHDVEYHRKHYAEEVQRTNERNTWVRQLRESLQFKFVTA